MVRKRVRADSTVQVLGSDLGNSLRSTVLVVGAGLRSRSRISGDTKNGGRVRGIKVWQKRSKKHLCVGGVAARVGHSLRGTDRGSVVEF